ncbi:LysR family transcriptional regulator [Microbacterium esteraromaticum]|uniref:LysR family transcriptional regulator n=1 Tax=Microbacterium esteraromaticum TaxID=57043 RepID=UPI001A8F1C53|nr:LysR family transcriptional regulator [Microbacterium esteraromaticum]MBN8423500.1 LysR family transcriptional regulator [Microbacterium esteraromaticum]
MDLQQLRYVVEVLDTASFTRAAERCFVTQSALSHQIAALEREIGQRLFIRSSRSVRPTEAGEAFALQARIAVEAAENAVEEAAAAAGRIVGTLTLGVIPTVTAVDLPALLSGFREKYPDVRVELRVGSSDMLMRQASTGEIDVALLGLRDDVRPQGVAFRALRRDRLVVVLPTEHPLASRSEISLADLTDETFADFPQGSSGRAQSDGAFADAGIPRDVAFEVDTVDMLLGLVEAGLAVTLLAPGAVRGVHAAVVVTPIVDGPHRTEYLAWHATGARSAARAFVAQIESDAAR